MDALQQHPQAEIVGLVDAYKGRLDRALSRTKVHAGRAKIYPTHRDLLAEKSIDAVVGAIADHPHKAVVVDALRAGKDVYCEKPLTDTAAEGLEIIWDSRHSLRGETSSCQHQRHNKLAHDTLAAIRLCWQPFAIVFI
jgi:predicted dehydrogenase